MAFGLKVSDANGIVQLDTSDGVVTILGIASYTLSSTFYSGSFTNSGFSKGRPFYMLVDIPVDVTYNTGLRTHINFSGTTCSWNVEPSPYAFGGNDQSGKLTFYYGYY